MRLFPFATESGAPGRALAPSGPLARPSVRLPPRIPPRSGSNRTLPTPLQSANVVSLRTPDLRSASYTLAQSNISLPDVSTVKEPGAHFPQLNLKLQSAEPSQLLATSARADWG